MPSTQKQRNGQFGCQNTGKNISRKTNHLLLPVRLLPGLTVGGQEIPNGIGKTRLGRMRAVIDEKCDDNRVKRQERKRSKLWGRMSSTIQKRKTCIPVTGNCYGKRCHLLWLRIWFLLKDWSFAPRHWRLPRARRGRVHSSTCCTHIFLTHCLSARSPHARSAYWSHNAHALAQVLCQRCLEQNIHTHTWFIHLLCCIHSVMSIFLFPVLPPLLRRWQFRDPYRHLHPQWARLRLVFPSLAQWPTRTPAHFLMGSHHDLPHSHSSSVWLELWTVLLNGTLYTQDKILFFLQQPALRFHFVVVILFFLCKPYATRNKTVMILSLLDRYWQQINKMVITRIGSTRSLFRHNAHEWNHTVCTDQLAWAKRSLKKIKKKIALTRSCLLHEKELWQSHTSLTAHKTRGRNGEKMYSVTNRRYLRRHECPLWRSMKMTSLPREVWVPCRNLTHFVSAVPISRLPISMLMCLVWAPFLPGRRWRWNSPSPGWMLPSGWVPLLVSVFRSLLLLGVLDLVLSDFQLRG